MPKTPKEYFGKLPVIPGRQIYLNADYLEDGEYLLKIVHNNKIIKYVRFKK